MGLGRGFSLCFLWWRLGWIFVLGCRLGANKINLCFTLSGGCDFRAS